MVFLIKFKTGNFFIITKEKYFKIPFTLTSYENQKIEKNNLSKIKKDLFFKKFLIEEKFFFFIKISTRYKNMNINDDNFLTNYERLFTLKKIKKNKIIKLDFFKKILIIFKDNKILLKKLRSKFANLSVKNSSCHGDFYYQNILKHNDNYFFIDWDRYQNKMPLYYDSINYIIFSKKNYSGSWFSSWKNNYNFLIKHYPKLYVQTYVLCKTSLDMMFIKLNKKKKEKYLKIFTEYLSFVKKN